MNRNALSPRRHRGIGEPKRPCGFDERIRERLYLHFTL